MSLTGKTYMHFPIKFDFIFHNYIASPWLIHDFPTTNVGYPHDIPLKKNQLEDIIRMTLITTTSYNTMHTMY